MRWSKGTAVVLVANGQRGGLGVEDIGGGRGGFKGIKVPMYWLYLIWIVLIIRRPDFR